jgi:hypothetical protein
VDATQGEITGKLKKTTHRIEKLEEKIDKRISGIKTPLTVIPVVLAVFFTCNEHGQHRTHPGVHQEMKGREDGRPKWAPPLFLLSVAV